MERREAHLVSFRFRHRVRSDGSSESASPCGAPLRRFWARGPYFRVRTGELVIPDPTAFAAFIRTASSRERQSHVVGPDGDPSLPDNVCAKHVRGRRILLRFKAPSRSAPHEQDTVNLSAAGRAGMRIPITKCFWLHSLDTIRCHSGARIFARARNPCLILKWLITSICSPARRTERSISA